MCGLSGIIQKNNVSVKKNDIKLMNDLIEHRGPDDEGYFFERNFALGHKRLSIIDLSEKGHQPMNYLNKYIIVFNGEIYNYIELKRQLVKIGYKFNSETDTEVILASYDKWGTDCVIHFNGMWSFALYDRLKNTIFLSRDRFGIKPLYFANVNNQFVFGSEIKQIIKFFSDKKMNLNVLMDYLVLGFEDHSDSTFYKDVFKLQASHNLVYNLVNNNYNIYKYYEIKFHDLTNISNNEAIKIFKENFNNSISLRLRSDVKVGTCLSGGLDSSSIATIASNLYKSNSSKQFHAITAKSIEKDSDESYYAKLVASNSDLKLFITKPGETDFDNKIDDIIKLQEEPFGLPNVLMQYFVFEKAAEQKCKVMLDGQGGDEILLGYERYYPAYLLSLEKLSLVKEFFKSSQNSKLSQKQLFYYMIYFTSSFIRLKLLMNKNNFIYKDYLNIIDKKLIQDHGKSYRNVFELQKLEISKLQLEHLLKYEDRNSMFHSIESRLPFLDYKLVEMALSFDVKFKFRNGYTKHILRKAMDGIMPDEVVWRKNKFGFNSPEKYWNNKLDCSLPGLLNNSSIFNNISNINKLKLNLPILDLKKKWRIFNLIKWEKLNNIEFKIY